MLATLVRIDAPIETQVRRIHRVNDRLGVLDRDDEIRVGMLVSRTTSQADGLEQQYVPGHDEPMDAFRDELNAEGNHGHK